MNTLRPETNLIVAYDQAGAIGKAGDLPWGRSLPSDLANFKRQTLDGTVIMGRKTFDSIGRPLPRRENIVISRSASQLMDGVLCVNSIAQALSIASHDPYIIGGSEIYRQSIESDVVDRIYASEVHETFEGTDTFFPTLDPSDWDEVSRITGQGESDGYDFDFVIYDRKK